MARAKKRNASDADRQVGEPKERFGDATLAVMAMSGLVNRKRAHRRWAVVAAAAVGAMALAVVLDLLGVWDVPLVDLHTAAAPVGQAVAHEEPSTAERERIRRKLLGQGQPPPAEVPRGRMTAAERAALLDVYGSKRDRKIVLSNERDAVAPDLPRGLTQEAIYEVVGNNNSSVSLCVSDSVRRGEKLQGKVDVEMTIEAAGTVSSAVVVSPKHASTVFAQCLVKRIKSWRFPSFRGEAVTVVYPYVVSGP